MAVAGDFGDQAFIHTQRPAALFPDGVHRYQQGPQFFLVGLDRAHVAEFLKGPQGAVKVAHLP